LTCCCIRHHPLPPVPSHPVAVAAADGTCWCAPPDSLPERRRLYGTPPAVPRGLLPPADQRLPEVCSLLQLGGAPRSPSSCSSAASRRKAMRVQSPAPPRLKDRGPRGCYTGRR
jgi:hypothetical protein